MFIGNESMCREEGGCLLTNGDDPSCRMTCHKNFDQLTINNDTYSEIRGVRVVLSHIYRMLSTDNRAKETQKLIVLQWRTVSIVMDRLFFMLYLMAIACSISMLFPRPHNEDFGIDLSEEKHI